MKKYLLILVSIILLSTLGLSCVMSFEPSSISSQLGNLEVFKVTVIKDHNKCTLDSMDDYHFEFENLQITGYTDWEQISYNTYEKYFQISPSETGVGEVKIWKNCTKEGYEEKVLKITTSENPELFSSLLNGNFEVESDLSNGDFDIYEFEIEKETLIDTLQNGLVLYESLELNPGKYFALYSNDFKSAISVFNNETFYRFDHYIAYYGE